MLTSKQVREQWYSFRQSKWHNHAKAVSLVADSENKSVLFTVAGMQPFVPYLVGKPHALGKRLFNIQKCIRTNDIDDIGDERHCSMFEMMGNRSLGDYFKKDAITRSLEFLVDVLWINKSKLGATIFAGDQASWIPRDDESFGILQSLGIEHIKEMSFDEYGESDNFRTPWPVGPCGPCVEFYFDRGDAHGLADRDMGVNDRYTEVWNNVMMAYYRDGSGSTAPWQQNVDTWMGFERLNMLLQGTETIFETDVFADSIQTIQWFTDTTYDAHKKEYRIILDHFRASTFLICDGVVPSNEGRWYVLRRLIRRGYFNYSKLIQNNQNEEFEKFLIAFVTWVIDMFAPRYDSMEWKTEFVVRLLVKECQQFQQTISNGLGELDKYIKKWSISGADTFRLFESFWLPRDVIKDVLLQHGLQADKGAFDVESEKAKERSRQWAAFVKNIERSKYLTGVPETVFTGYSELQSLESKLLKDFTTDNGQRVLIFDRTPFYATGGGQVGDSGEIRLDNGEIVSIREVIKYAGVYLHLVG